MRALARQWLALGLARLALGCSGAPASSLAETAVSPDSDGARGKLAACLGLSLDATLFWLLPEREGGLSDLQRACLFSAVSCGEVQACVGLREGPCPEVASCEAGRATTCERPPGRPELVRDEACSGSADGNDTCAIASGHDGEDRWAMCNAGSCQRDACDGDVRISCIAGLSERYDCAAVGKRCVDSGELAYCAYETACEADHCEGDTLVLCSDGRATFHERCNDVVPGTGCISYGTTYSCGIASELSPCAEGEANVECHGALARFCHLGIWVEVDCGALGAKCGPRAAGDIVACTPP